MDSPTFAKEGGARFPKEIKAVRAKYLITVASIMGAAAASILVQHLLKSHVSESMRQGAGMYVMWICLYPAIKAWSRKPKVPSVKKRPLTFMFWTMLGLLPAVLVTIAHIYFP